MLQCYRIRVEVKTQTLDLTRPEGKGGQTRRRVASERQINSLPLLFAVKMIRQWISFTNRLTFHSTTPTNRGGNDKLDPNTADLRVDHHLIMMELKIIRTSLFPSLN